MQDLEVDLQEEKDLALEIVEIIEIIEIVQGIKDIDILVMIMILDIEEREMIIVDIFLF